MQSNAILFQFSDAKSASLACDLLQELGYEPEIPNEQGSTLLNIPIERNDITSALEIAQAHGGQLVERADHFSMEAADEIAYRLEDIPIPAHMVNEDWPESYATGIETELPEDDEPAFDPSADTYDYLSGDVHA